MTLAIALRRLPKELMDLRNSKEKAFREISVEETNLFLWELLLQPEHTPYNEGAFRIRIDFSSQYPIKPPKITFLTKIYHPNIDKDGVVCMHIITEPYWKPGTRLMQVLNTLMSILDNPDPEYPIRPELAEEYNENKEKFYENADDFTKRFSEKRVTA